MNASDFLAAYLEAAMFTDTGEPGQPASDAELSPEARHSAEIECRRFRSIASRELAEAVNREGYDSTMAGHDFWLTRNRHGAGYWDRKELEGDGLGDRLTALAHAMGDRDLYAGEDGLLYFAP